MFCASFQWQTNHYPIIQDIIQPIGPLIFGKSLRSHPWPEPITAPIEQYGEDSERFVGIHSEPQSALTFDICTPLPHHRSSHSRNISCTIPNLASNFVPTTARRPVYVALRNGTTCSSGETYRVRDPKHSSVQHSGQWGKVY